MAKRKRQTNTGNSSKKVGACVKRNLPVRHNNLCDLYQPKRAGRFKIRCRNCVHYQKPSTQSNLPCEVQDDVIDL